MECGFAGGKLGGLVSLAAMNVGVRKLTRNLQYPTYGMMCSLIKA